ncbi:MAG TPA: cobalt-precorrin-4 C(11)-methyltransferase, partial [Euryarchaeota archaeon]|nr:cobalt-precorrin-4 C(11)-methyltransferase [Euryarchaeota archaeon]
MKVYFVGSGPGDPELITLKAKRILEKADVVVYASSLVDDRILGFIRPEAEVYTSAPLTLREIVELLRREAEKGRVVVRLHSGDASIYGAIGEQITELEKHGIECEVVPGVSSFLAAAALLKKEYTVPGVSQTVIISRISGRTDVPERERLSLLAEHGASM